MNKYRNFLNQIAEDFNIKQGKIESEANFKARVIYSVICRLSYASLWDNSSSLTISVRHFKDKIDELLKIYLELYPEVKISENLSEEIYDLYLRTGNFYHKAHKISASIFSVSKQKNILFMRGITPQQKTFISGAGFYLSNQNDCLLNEVHFKNFVEMFGLQSKTLPDFWHEIIYSVDWKESEIPHDAEFLRMSPPFNKGYWQKNPIHDGRISLLRSGQFEPKNYYLYKFENKKFFCSQLPEWRVYEDFYGKVYRQIACACLSAYKILPPIKFKIEGSIVQTKFEYLPSPAELYLMLLYSWAKSPEILPNNFNRIFDVEIFFAIKSTLEKIGYDFVEE